MNEFPDIELEGVLFDLLDTFMRLVAESFSKDASAEWAIKYGTNFENDLFMMHPYCWCEKEDCPWCVGIDSSVEARPNFHFKPTDFKVTWYKYIGRSMMVNKQISSGEILDMMKIIMQSKSDKSSHLQNTEKSS